jgi:hypothetical protein
VKNFAGGAIPRSQFQIEMLLPVAIRAIEAAALAAAVAPSFRSKQNARPTLPQPAIHFK